MAKHHGYIKLINATDDLDPVVFVVSSSLQSVHYPIRRGPAYAHSIDHLPTIGFAVAAFNPHHEDRLSIGGGVFELRVPFEVIVSGKSGNYKCEINPLE